jgi:putative tricarboxylic transport membrane protein
MRRIMKRADQITGVITLVFSLALMEGARRMPPSATFGPGAGFLPFWCGALLALLSTLLIVDAFRRPAVAATKPVFPAGRVLLVLAAVVAGLTAYVLTLELLGFLVATALLTAYLLGFVQEEKWTTTIVVAVLNSAALYIVFEVLLGVSLPANRFGF